MNKCTIAHTNTTMLPRSKTTHDASATTAMTLCQMRKKKQQQQKSARGALQKNEKNKMRLMSFYAVLVWNVFRNRNRDYTRMGLLINLPRRSHSGSSSPPTI
eukprot:GEMP01060969.1.p1 GENE.GEMP01060969.1~~GEMP01060969.1.p1  ORF type:complete len:102 (-),score=12.71 GEMP01060969.1:853-1158(-)